MMAQAEPAFQVEMQRMMEQPEMRKVVSVTFLREMHKKCKRLLVLRHLDES